MQEYLLFSENIFWNKNFLYNYNLTSNKVRNSALQTDKPIKYPIAENKWIQKYKTMLASKKSR